MVQPSKFIAQNGFFLRHLFYSCNADYFKLSLFIQVGTSNTFNNLSMHQCLIFQIWNCPALWQFLQLTGLSPLRKWIPLLVFVFTSHPIHSVSTHFICIRSSFFISRVCYQKSSNLSLNRKKLPNSKGNQNRNWKWIQVRSNCTKVRPPK